MKMESGGSLDPPAVYVSGRNCTERAVQRVPESG